MLAQLGISWLILLANTGELGNIGKYANSLGLVFPEDDVKLQPLSGVELLVLETQFMGLTTGEHVMTFYQQWMAKRGVLGSRSLQKSRHGRKVQVAGEVVMHQAPPTAKGFHFITLEDKDGMMNIIVRPAIYRRFRRVLRHAPLLLVTGTLQREGDIANVLCEHATIMPQLDRMP